MSHSLVRSTSVCGFGRNGTGIHVSRMVVVVVVVVVGLSVIVMEWCAAGAGQSTRVHLLQRVRVLFRRSSTIQEKLGNITSGDQAQRRQVYIHRGGIVTRTLDGGSILVYSQSRCYDIDYGSIDAATSVLVGDCRASRQAEASKGACSDVDQ